MFKIFFLLFSIFGTVIYGSEEDRTTEDHIVLTFDGPWGDWGVWEFCDDGYWVVSFETRVQPYQGLFSDDTSMNGVRMYCNDPAQKLISSTVAGHGEWSSLTEKSVDGFNGASLKIEEDSRTDDPFDDDTAANGLRLITPSEDEYETDNTGDFGHWRDKQSCVVDGWKICGIKTQVETDGHTDDTAMNGIELACCFFPETVGKN